MQQMLDELMGHEYTIPLELIVKCKELIQVEKEQIIKAHNYAYTLGEDISAKYAYEAGDKYYNRTYRGNKMKIIIKDNEGKTMVFETIGDVQEISEDGTTFFCEEWVFTSGTKLNEWFGYKGDNK